MILAAAIIFTLCAILLTLLVTGANGMRSSPGRFEGAWIIMGAWAVAAFFWIGWWFGA